MTTENMNESPLSESLPAQEPQEKMVPQSHVNKLVVEAKLKGRAQAMSEIQQNNEQPQQQQPILSQPSGDREDIRKILSQEFDARDAKMREEAQKFQAHQAYQHAANEVAQKVKEAEKRIPDYAETLASVGHFSQAPGIIMLANTVDNAGDVLYELAKNPHKIGSLVSTIQAGIPQAAEGMIKALSKSIKQNQESSGDKLPDEPLSQPKPTNIGVGKAPTTASDFAKQYRGRY